MTTKVFKYGALPVTLDSEIRKKMKLAREYYNQLVEAENGRRKTVWGGERPKQPPHEHKDEPVCEECKKHWKDIRDKYFATPPLDIKPLRAKASEAGLYWGTYLIIEESFSAAWKKTDGLSTVRYKSWRDGGIMGVQLQQAHSANGFYRIEQAPDPRKGRKAGQRHAVKIRIGTRENKPVWSEPIAFEMHRPLQGRPTWVKICYFYRGEREIWSVNITCTDVPERALPDTAKVLAIDIGWRVMSDDSIRAAYARDENGNESELLFDSRWRECGDRADRIRSARDDRLNELKKKDTRFSLIKKPSGIRGYVAKNSIEDTEVTEWIKQDRHLEQYELGCRRRSVAVRKEKLRVWLSSLRKQYATAIIKDSSHKEMKAAKRAKADGMPPPARRNAHHGAPGEIVEEICRAFGRQTNIAIVEAPGTTATCASCGQEMEIGAELMITCERCNAREDRDCISTRNMLRLYASGNCKKPTARKTIARFAKRHKNYVEPNQCQRDGL